MPTPPFLRSASWAIVARGALACIALVAAIREWGPGLVEFARPVVAATIASIAPDFRVVDLSVDASGVETMLRLRVAVGRMFVVAGHVIQPDPRGEGNVALPVGTTMVAPLLALTWIAAAVPWRHPLRPLARITIALPLLAVAWLADTSLSLVSLVWGFIHDAFDPGGFSPLAAWEPLMAGGGRLALGVLVGVGLAGLPGWPTTVRTADGVPARPVAPASDPARKASRKRPSTRPAR